tara:strand:- start:231 stop:542 length:312 start_codon:yes stop_codon:yes gene_type:complete
MKYKCVYRDMLGCVKVLEVEAESVEASMVGLHEKCRATVNAVDTVDKSQLMVWLEFMFDEDMNHFKIMYPSQEGDTDVAALQQMTGETVIIMPEPLFPEEQSV